MSIILNSISVIATFIVSVGVLWLILDNTIGRLNFTKSKNDWFGFQIKDAAFISFSAFIVLYYFDFYLPY